MFEASNDTKMTFLEKKPKTQPKTLKPQSDRQAR